MEMMMLATNADPKDEIDSPEPKIPLASQLASSNMRALMIRANMPNVRMVTGKLSTCRTGLIDALIRAKISAVNVTGAQPPCNVEMPGTMNTANPTAMAHAIQRRMKFMSGPFGIELLGARSGR